MARQDRGAEIVSLATLGLNGDMMKQEATLLVGAEEGLIKNIKNIIRSFAVEADNYIRKIYSCCKEELDIENYRNKKGYRNNEENIIIQEQVVKEIEYYINDVPIPIPILQKLLSWLCGYIIAS